MKHSSLPYCGRAKCRFHAFYVPTIPESLKAKLVHDLFYTIVNRNWTGLEQKKLRNLADQKAK